MTTDENKLQILKKVESGTLSVEEGSNLLAILERGESSSAKAESAAAEVLEPVQDEPLPEKVPAGWRALWSIFIYLGILFMGLSGLWLYSSYTRSAMGVGFWFATFFLLLSALIVFFGWRLVAEHWMVVRIRSKEDGRSKRILFWVPLPIHFILRVLRTFSSHVPVDAQGRRLDEVLAELDGSLKEGEVFQVDLDGDGKTSFKVDADF
jgi:hypothetical protein